MTLPFDRWGSVRNPIERIDILAVGGSWGLFQYFLFLFVVSGYLIDLDKPSQMQVCQICLLFDLQCSAQATGLRSWKYLSVNWPLGNKLVLEGLFIIKVRSSATDSRLYPQRTSGILYYFSFPSFKPSRCLQKYHRKKTKNENQSYGVDLLKGQNYQLYE